MKATLRVAVLAMSAGFAALALACSDSDVVSGGPDAGAAADAGDAAMAHDAAADVIDASQGVPRCHDATYSTAPSGAACDPMRIQQQRGLEGSCYGPAIGALCARFQVSVPVADVGKLPSGFVCGSAELGVATCVWSFDGDAAPAHAIDAPALEGACAATTALPTANVVCVNYGD